MDERVRSSSSGAQGSPLSGESDPESGATSSDLCRVCVIVLIGLESSQMLGLF